MLLSLWSVDLMKKKKKHIRILILMITSQVLLTLFVVQWLRTQYGNEKKMMTSEIDRLYLAAQDELIDTLLFNSYVVPVIDSAGDGAIKHIISVSDSLTVDSMTQLTKDVTRNNIFWKGTKGAITVRINSEGDSLPTLPDTIKIRKLNDEMLLRSVKLMVTHTSGPVKEGFNGSFALGFRIDSLKFIDSFVQKMHGEEMKFHISWYKAMPDSAPASKGVLLVNPMSPFSLPSLAITRYSGFLLNKILPQIFFGIVLIFITALAFFLSYRSIRDHLIMNSLRNEFISNITHELRTPVATIGVALESLGKYNPGNDPSLTEKYLALASVETKRLEELINRVLDNSLLEEARESLSFTDTDISELIREVAGIMKLKLERSGNIEVTAPAEPIRIKCDPLYLRGALINLVENSIKYCDKTPLIKISVQKESDRVKIEVSDNGPGIPSGYHKRIFGKFFRLPSENIHNVKGYGLGLSFVSQVMKLHKGGVNVRNLSQGCCFTLEIPSD